MILLILGLVLFFGVHSVSIVNRPWRDRMVARLGEWPWKGLYSLVAIPGFILICWGYGSARQDPLVLYQSPAWLRHVALLLMVPVFPLLFAAYLPGRIKTAAKHPMLAATKFWALAHLLVNGTLADVLLFGGFPVWASVDRIAVKRRPQSPTPATAAFGVPDVIALAGGLGVYVLFIVWLHAKLLGVSPI